MEPQKGRRYKHFEGDIYRVLYIAIHTETSEEFVIYQNITTNSEELKASPLEIFLGEVTTKSGKIVNRFNKVD